LARSAFFFARLSVGFEIFCLVTVDVVIAEEDFVAVMLDAVVAGV
jgi:hypothetical protein